MSNLPSEIELQESAAGKNACWSPEADSAEAKALKVPSGVARATSIAFTQLVFHMCFDQ